MPYGSSQPYEGLEVWGFLTSQACGPGFLPTYRNNTWTGQFLPFPRRELSGMEDLDYLDI